MLQNEAVCTHDLLIGELACGYLRNREEVLGLLLSLPRLSAATEDGTHFFIERRRLMGCGIGYIDAHLLAAAVIRDVPIWTKDKRLMAIANALYWSTKSTRHTETSAQQSMRNSVFKTNNSVLVHWKKETLHACNVM